MNQTVPTPPAPLLDELDRAIVSLLQDDGRKAFTEIAKQLTIPESTVRYRVQRLIQAEILQINARLNLQKLGLPHIVTMRLNVERDAIDAVSKAIAAMPETQFVAIITGQYNIVMDACFNTHETLLDIFAQIDAMSGIVHYDSCMALKLLKSEYQYMLS